MDNPQIIVESLGALPYGGIFILFLLANIVIPFPEEVFIIAIGYIGSMGLINVYIAGALAICGLLTSDIIIFSLIRQGNKFLIRIGKFLLGKSFTEDTAFFRNHVKKIIFFTRFIVSVRFLGLFIAGTLKVKRKIFIFYDGLAILIFVPILIFIGDYFHKQFSAIVSGVEIARYWILFLVLVVLFMYFSRYFRRMLLKKFFSPGNKNIIQDQK